MTPVEPGLHLCTRRAEHQFAATDAEFDSNTRNFEIEALMIGGAPD